MADLALDGLIILAVIAGAAAVLGLLSYLTPGSKVRPDPSDPADPGEPKP